MRIRTIGGCDCDICRRQGVDDLSNEAQKMGFYSDSIVDQFSDTNPKDLQGSKKAPLSLVPSSVLIHLANAFKEGAEKYGAYNWRTKKVKASIYIDAAMRHLQQYNDGEDVDPESMAGKTHLAGAVASLAVLIDAIETGNVVDDRPPPGPASRLLRSSKDD